MVSVMSSCTGPVDLIYSYLNNKTCIKKLIIYSHPLETAHEINKAIKQQRLA